MEFGGGWERGEQVAENAFFFVSFSEASLISYRIYQAMSEAGYYMRIAIDINKKVGGTRAYGTFSTTQKQKQTTEIDLQ